MKLLITGANGLLGGHAARQLAAAHEVHAVVRSLPHEPAKGVTYHVLDLASDWNADVLPTRIDAVLHLAQSARFREFPEQADDVFRVNVASTARLLDYARRADAGHFLLASSGGVYGAGEEAFPENAPIPSHGELGFYLGSKLCAEVLAQNYASILNIAVLRFFFIYGAGQKRSMLMPRLVDNIRAGQPVKLQGESGIRINPIHVSDAVRAMERCLQLQGSHTFNIAGAQVLSMREIGGIIGDAVGVKPVFISEPGAARHLVANIDAMREHLAAPAIALEQGIRDLLG